MRDASARRPCTKRLAAGPTSTSDGGSTTIDRAKGHFFNQGDNVMSKSQDSKKNVKKAPSKTPKEKKEAKRLKKAGG